MENFYLKDLIKAVDGSFVMGNKLLPVNDVEIDISHSAGKVLAYSKWPFELVRCM